MKIRNMLMIVATTVMILNVRDDCLYRAQKALCPDSTTMLIFASVSLGSLLIMTIATIIED